MRVAITDEQVHICVFLYRVDDRPLDITWVRECLHHASIETLCNRLFREPQS